MVPEMMDVNTEYEKNPKISKKLVLELVNWVNHLDGFPKFTELQALLFARKSNNNLFLTMETIKCFLTVRTFWLDLFNGKPLTDPNYIDITKAFLIMVLPERTPNDESIIFMKTMHTINTTCFSHEIFLKYLDSILLLDIYKNGSSAGHRIFFDMKDCPEEHFVEFPLSLLKKFFFYVQEYLPINLKGLHFINCRDEVQPFFETVQAAVPKVYLPLTHSHWELQGIREFIPMECLPADYKGCLNSISKLDEQNQETLCENKDFLEWICKQKFDFTEFDDDNCSVKSDDSDKSEKSVNSIKSEKSEKSTNSETSDCSEDSVKSCRSGKSQKSDNSGCPRKLVKAWDSESSEDSSSESSDYLE